jgi:hypothetical protein
MKRNVFSWIVALACVLCGVFYSYLLHTSPEHYRGDFQILAVRIVFYIGPLGWLLFSLLAAFFIIRFPGSSLASVFVICCLLALIAAGCVLMFAPISYPPFRGGWGFTGKVHALESARAGAVQNLAETRLLHASRERPGVRRARGWTTDARCAHPAVPENDRYFDIEQPRAALVLLRWPWVIFFRAFRLHPISGQQVSSCGEESRRTTGLGSAFSAVPSGLWQLALGTRQWTAGLFSEGSFGTEGELAGAWKLTCILFIKSRWDLCWLCFINQLLR